MSNWKLYYFTAFDGSNEIVSSNVRAYSEQEARNKIMQELNSPSFARFRPYTNIRIDIYKVEDLGYRG